MSWNVVVDSIFSEVTREISAFCNTVENFNTCIVFFRKEAFLKTSRSPHLTRVAGLRSTICNATKNKLAKFLKGSLKLT